VAVFRLRVRGIRVRVTVMADPIAVDRRVNGGRASRGALTTLAFAEAPLRGWHRITLPRDLCTPGLVAHEALHVAVAAGRAGRLPDEEPLAYAVQALTDAIWRRVARLQGEACGRLAR